MADKGIRPAAKAKFAELNILRRAGTAPYTGEKANTIFRKNVMGFLMEQFSISLASAATHYNEAFKSLKESDPAAVEGLGRPEDKKGGRKKKETPVGAAAPTDAAPAGEQQPTETPTGEEQPSDEQPTASPNPEQTVFTVKKKSDNTVVAENLSFEQAQELINKAAAAKKAKLYWV